MFLIFDTETTGLPAKYGASHEDLESWGTCRLVQLAWQLHDETGKLLAREQQSYSPYYSSQPGWAEQDPDLYWKSLVAACQGLRKKDPKSFAAIAGVGVTSQRATMINVDKKGQVLRPAIVWHRVRSPEQRGIMW